jgi:hypothetical protein
MFPAMLKGWSDTRGAHPIDRVRIVPPALPKALVTKIREICQSVSGALNWCGWLDVDLIVGDGEMFVLEVNARYSATTRAIYMATNVNPFQAHIDAILRKRTMMPAAIGHWVFELPFAGNALFPAGVPHYVHERAQDGNFKARITFSVSSVEEVSQLSTCLQGHSGIHIDLRKRAYQYLADIEHSFPGELVANAIVSLNPTESTG